VGDLLVGRGSERFSSSFAVHSSLPAGKKKIRPKSDQRGAELALMHVLMFCFFDPFCAVNLFERRYGFRGPVCLSTPWLRCVLVVGTDHDAGTKVGRHEKVKVKMTIQLTRSLGTHTIKAFAKSLSSRLASNRINVSGRD